MMYILRASILVGFATVVIAATSGQLVSINGVQGILERAMIRNCKSVEAPATCESSCGPGHIQCVSFPNCYNPGLGQKCCSDGGLSSFLCSFV